MPFLKRNNPMTQSSEYWEERISELELEKERLEDKFGDAVSRILELQIALRETKALLAERTEQRDAYRAALADLKK